MSREEISRGERARQILHDEMFQEAIKFIKEDNYKQFLRSTDSEDRDEIWRQQQAIDSFLHRLESVLKTGQMAAKTNE